ncbi:DUF4097 family beta strand repeat-containing protein [Kitasatospora sp. NPDC052868]|uniref:DUF4097 family beta strand repeat-containing protein n=1 Tax=Kitasatospora sp. NPDC052868 TaxID=3364060 RepID=UPI0037C6A0FE
MRGARAWRITGTLALVVAVSFGAVQTWAVVVQQKAVSSRTYHVGVTRVQLDTGSAAVRIRPGRDGRVLVRQDLDWTVRRPVVSTVFEGDLLIVRMRCNQVLPVADFGCGASFDLEVPAAASVTGKGSSGSVAVRGLSGDVRLEATSGAVELADLSGQVSVRTTSGEVRGAGLTSSRVEVGTTSGEVRLTFAQQPKAVDIGVTSGALSLVLPAQTKYNFTGAAGSFFGDNGSGNRHIDTDLVDPTSANTVRLSAGSGSVVVSAADD